MMSSRVVKSESGAGDMEEFMIRDRCREASAIENVRDAGGVRGPGSNVRLHMRVVLVEAELEEARMRLVAPAWIVVPSLRDQSGVCADTRSILT